MSNMGRCTLQSYSNTTIECLCDICDTKSDRRRLASQSVVVATQVSAMTSFVYKEYISTMNQYNDINWYQAIKQSAVIVISFIVVWSSVIIFVPLKAIICNTVNKSKLVSKKVDLEPIMPETNPSEPPEITIRNYILKYLPIIYDDEIHYFYRLFTQITRKHLYYELFTNSDKDKNIASRYINGFKILTHISVIIRLILILNANVHISSVLCFS